MSELDEIYNEALRELDQVRDKYPKNEHEGLIMDTILSNHQLDKWDEHTIRNKLLKAISPDCSHELYPNGKTDADGGCVMVNVNCSKCGYEMYKWYEIDKWENIWKHKTDDCTHQSYHDNEYTVSDDAVTCETNCMKCGFSMPHRYLYVETCEFD